MVVFSARTAFSSTAGYPCDCVWKEEALAGPGIAEAEAKAGQTSQLHRAADPSQSRGRLARWSGQVRDRPTSHVLYKPRRRHALRPHRLSRLPRERAHNVAGQPPFSMGILSPRTLLPSSPAEPRTSPAALQREASLGTITANKAYRRQACGCMLKTVLRRPEALQSSGAWGGGRGLALSLYAECMRVEQTGRQMVKNSPARDILPSCRGPWLMGSSIFLLAS